MLLQQRGNKHLGVEGSHNELNLGHRYGNCFELPLDHSAIGVHAHTYTHTSCKYYIIHYISLDPIPFVGFLTGVAEITLICNLGLTLRASMFSNILHGSNVGSPLLFIIKERFS